jgi:ABC-type Fe3+ transport system substrate-binding protein
MHISKLAQAVLCAIAVAGLTGVAQAKTELLVYTAVEADELAKFKQAIETDYPDLDIKWVRDSTGIITAKLLAEKANPQADVVWGLAATSLKLLADQGYFQAYAPKGVDALDPQICRQSQAAQVGRTTRLGRGTLFQHRRSRKSQSACTDLLAGSDQAGIQGQGRDAQSQFFRHRLP